MFKITEETRNDAIKAMDEILQDAPFPELSEEEAHMVIGQAFDAAVAIVMKQFGL